MKSPTTEPLKDLRRDILTGLSHPNKTLPCKYLYDQTGALLFDAICELEEYYLTRTELSILQQNIPEIASLIGPRATLVDLGSGSARKTRLLLDHLQRPASYVPVDVSRAQLLECSEHIARDYAHLAVHPLCADYTTDFDLPLPSLSSGKTTIFFPGSTIGNFEPHEAVSFLRRLGSFCGEAGGVLIGVDLKKPAQLLNRAYNDAQGITARFNLNLLARLNRELGARFDLSRFEHHAFYSEAAARIEMHLVSRGRQTVPVDGATFHFAPGEPILTEHSYKYSVPEFQELATQAGFEVARCWTDARGWFSVHFLRPRR
jgi:dimethylhistidine N-methyltransferase